MLESVRPLRYLSLCESVEEFAALLNRQLDLRLEAENLERFARNFRGNRHVVFPVPVRPLVSDEVQCEALNPKLYTLTPTP